MTPGPQDPFQQAMSAFGRGMPGEAIALFDQVLAAQPAHAHALHFKGYALCQMGRFPEGVPLLEQALAARPLEPAFNANLGMIRFVMGDLPGAIRTLERTVKIAPGLAEAWSNLAMALRDAGQFDRALAAARRAVQLRPEFPAARLNLAMALLSAGRWEEAWEAYRWRHDPRANVRDLGIAPTIPHATRLPAPLAGAALTLHGEQGLGDVLFFFRYAAALREAGASLRFWGDARVGPLLERNALVNAAVAGREPPAGTDPERLLWMGDLPALLGKRVEFPGPAPLAASARHREAARQRLAALGPAPYIAIGWRAGLPRAGKAVLSKSVDPAALGAALAGVPGTVVSLQREPVAAEAGALAAALAAPLHDLSDANADLESMLALLDCVDEYVAVSNTNVHLRAGLGKATRVLVPWPPEWRWTRDAERSPWFPGCPLYRASADGDWGAALGRLALDLR